MDLLFKRYASPFLLLDTYIESNELFEFIETIYEREEEEKLWEIHLSTLAINLYAGKAQSFNDFLKSSKSPKSNRMTKEEIEVTLKDSMDILNSFKPE